MCAMLKILLRRLGTSLSRNSDVMLFDVKFLLTSVPIDLDVPVCEVVLEADDASPERCAIEVADLTKPFAFMRIKPVFQFPAGIFQAPARNSYRCLYLSHGREFNH